MLVAGAAAVFGAFVAFKMMRGKKSQPEPQVEERKVSKPKTIGEKLQQENLNEVKLTENKYCLHPEFLIELLNFIGCEANERYF